MKIFIFGLFLLTLSGCAGKKLMRDCMPIGKNADGHMLAECEDL